MCRYQDPGLKAVTLQLSVIFKMRSFLLTMLFALLSVIFGVAMMMLMTMLTGDVYGALMGAIFATCIIALVWKA